MATCILPSDIWLKILSYLDFKDLISCSKVNLQLYEIAYHNSHWKRLCQKYWLITKCSEKATWKETFSKYYENYGRYVYCYAKIKTAWSQIIQFMKKNCPEIYDSVKEGTTETVLNKIEDNIGCILPDDLRCAYRIHNGQNLIVPGLLGSMSTLNHYRSDTLMDIETVADGFLSDNRCLPLTLCINTGVSVYIALDKLKEIEKHQIFYLSESVNVFLIAKNFTDWFTEYAWKLANSEFPIIDKQPFRFEHEPTCVSTTNSIQVSVATCFLPELSHIPLSSFYHAYRITMSMHPDALQSDSCQLETRHWLTIDEDGHEEVVNGPGVVGEYPIMRPGDSFSWISCTNFRTTYGSMQGYFTMRKLKTGERINVTCPTFHMRCLPYLTLNKRD